MAGIGFEHRPENQELNLVPWPNSWRDPIILDFMDASELIEMASRENGPWKGRRYSREINEGLGTRTWEEAVRLASDGWPEGRNKLTRTVEARKITTIAQVPFWAYDYAGAFPDVPLFIAGELECMVDRRIEYRDQRPLVKLAVSPLATHDTPDEQITNWGAALVSWIM